MPTFSLSLSCSTRQHWNRTGRTLAYMYATMQYWWDVFIFILCSSTPCTSTSVPTWCVCVVWNFEWAPAWILLLFVSVFLFFFRLMFSYEEKWVFPTSEDLAGRTHGKRIRVSALPRGFSAPIDLNWNKTNSCNMHLIATIIYTKPTTKDSCRHREISPFMQNVMKLFIFHEISCQRNDGVLVVFHVSHFLENPFFRLPTEHWIRSLDICAWLFHRIIPHHGHSARSTPLNSVMGNWMVQNSNATLLFSYFIRNLTAVAVRIHQSHVVFMNWCQCKSTVSPKLLHCMRFDFHYSIQPSKSNEIVPFEFRCSFFFVFIFHGILPFGFRLGI